VFGYNKSMEEKYWKTLDRWLSEGVDKGTLSEFCLGVGTMLQQDLKGTQEGKEVALEYVKAISDFRN
tara:strand:- start:612 stop:812 length:201 start_codon:yes stop_codon:yes gene_type:complete